MSILKLLLVVPTPPPYGGITNWTLLLQKYVFSCEDVKLTGLVNISPQNRVLDGRTLWDRIVGQGIEMFKHRKEMLKSISTECPDVIHMSTSGSLAVFRDILLLRAAKKNHVPMVYHLHFGRIPEIAEKNNWEWKLMKYAISLSSKVIVLDEKTCQTIGELVENAHVYKIANPIDLDVVKKIERKEQNITSKHKVMFLGWCVKTKGIEELLEAWEMLSKNYPEWELQIVGPIKENYREYLISNYSIDNVVMMGEKRHEEALEIMNEADIFVLPSHTEGFPMVILEAMALGKAIVATDVGAIGEMLGEERGIVIPAKNVRAVENALVKLTGNQKLRRDLGEKAKMYLNENYALAYVGEQYKKCWHEIL